MRINLIIEEQEKEDTRVCDIQILLKHRWMLLIIAGCSIFGMLYSGSIPQALETQMQAELNINNTYFNLIYCIGDFPTILLPLIGGSLVDYFGAKIMYFVSMITIFIGMCIMTLGCYNLNYSLIIFGRCIYSLMGDTLTIARFKIICRWFIYNQLGLALGLSLCFLKLGSITNNILTPIIYEWKKNIWFPTMIGALFCLISWLCGLIVIYMDHKLDRQEKILISSQDNTIQPQNNFKCSNIKQIDFLAWIYMISGSIIYSAFNCFSNNSNEYLELRFGYNNITAGKLITIIFIISFCLNFFTGIYIDTFGQRDYLATFSAAMLICSFTLFITFSENELGYLCIIPLVLMGSFLGVFVVAKYSILSCLVRKELLGTLMGIMNSITNLIGIVVSLFFAEIVDYLKFDGHFGYLWSIWMLNGLSFLGFIGFLIMIIYDREQKLKKV